MGDFGIKILSRMLERIFVAGITCIFALGGAIVGMITGAITGQTTETGFVRGAGIGVVAGAIVAVELLESLLNGDSSFKISDNAAVRHWHGPDYDKPNVGMFGSLINGKIFREWVCPAMLKAYQWQVDYALKFPFYAHIERIENKRKVGTLETSYIEISDIFDVQGTRGMPPNSVDKLPKFNIIRKGTVDQCGENISCSICLQDFNEGETARELPNCKHLFHLLCIDGWLIIQASCPVCRKDVL